MHLTPVGLDSGYSYMKAISQTKEIVFPNIVSPGREITDEGLNDILGQTGAGFSMQMMFDAAAIFYGAESPDSVGSDIKSQERDLFI